MSTESSPRERALADLERPLIDRLADVLALATDRELDDRTPLVMMIGQRHDENDEPTGDEVHGQITVGDLVPLILAIAGAER